MKELREAFLHPRKDFGPAPFWFWNSRMEPREIEEQMRQMAEKAVYEVFLHPRYGLETGYLSEDYWMCVLAAVRAAQELGMKVWLYDEYNWPSGPAGGFALRDDPANRAVGMVWVNRPARSEKGGGPPEPKEPQERLEHPVFQETELRDVLPACTGAAFTWDQPGYLNTFEQEAVRDFVEKTHEEYWKRFGTWFGSVIPGIFTDEPGFFNWRSLVGRVVLPWCKPLPSEFERRFGYDLLERMEELVLPVGEYRQTRHDFWKLVSEGFARSFSGQIRSWCERRGLLFTGHFLCEEELRSQAIYAGDLPANLMLLHVPGSDLLGIKTGYDPGCEGKAVAAKLVASVAARTGAGRQLCEALGAAGWSITLADTKRAVDWLAATGTNLLVPHAFYYSTQGFRKYEYPPSYFFQSPEWPHFAQFSKYVARVARLASTGRRRQEIAVLYPQTAGWALLDPDILGDPFATGPAVDPRWRLMQATIDKVALALLRIHADYDFVFENDLETSEVLGDELVIGQTRFRVLILPGVPLIRQGALDRAARFRAAGGCVIAVNQVPLGWPGGCGFPDGVETIEADFSDEAWGALDDIAFEGSLRRVLSSSEAASAIEFEPASRDLLVSHKAEHNRHIVFISNQAEDGVETVLLLRAGVSGSDGCGQCTGGGERVWRPTGPGGASVELWNPETGGMTPVPSRTCEGTVRIPIRLRSRESVFALVSGAAASNDLEASARFTQPAAGKSSAGNMLLTVEGPWEFEAEEGNIFPIAMAPREAPGDHGPGSNPDRDQLYEGSFCIDPDDTGAAGVPGLIESLGLELLWEDLQVSYVAVNGAPLSGRRIESWSWCRHHLLAPLTGMTRFGANTVALRAIIPSWTAPHRPPMVFLRGRFTASPSPGGKEEKATITRHHGRILPGSWTGQGFPRFSGTGRYTKSFALAGAASMSQARGTRIVLSVEARGSAEVAVNGSSVGTRIWPPYSFDVGRLLRDGENVVVLRISSSLGSLFGKEDPCGLLAYPVFLEVQDEECFVTWSG
ncbi:MAG: hypothetical protein HYY08_02295 [Firmicutes bacterium]|nr:hypothetical protein [Bacillota bacterium]